MQFKYHQSILNQATGQRNNAVLVAAAFFVLNLLQLGINLHLANNATMKFTPVPATLTEPFSIGRNTLSSNYLAQMSRQFALLRFNYTPATLPKQKSVLLRYVDANYFSEFKSTLDDDIKAAKANDISVTFIPTVSKVNLTTLSVTIQGVLIRYVGQTRLPEEDKTFVLHYHYNNGNLAITAIEALHSTKEAVSHA